MMPVDFNALAQQCAPTVHPTTLQALVRTESGFNPFAIGVVGGRLVRQPTSAAEAVATVRELDAKGMNYSMGMGQVNKANLVRVGLTVQSAFDPCASLKASAQILGECFERARARFGVVDLAMKAALSCYYSGNFVTGTLAPANGRSYVQKVVDNLSVPAHAVASVTPAQVPAIAVVQTTTRAVKETGIDAAAEALPLGKDGAVQTPHAAWDVFGEFPVAK